jgi:DnaJ family protein B protein 12
MLILLFFSLLSFLPSILNPPTPPPAFQFETSAAFPTQRLTTPHQVPYYVSPAFDTHPIGQSLPEKHKADRQGARFSPQLRQWEKEIEAEKIRELQGRCRWEMQNRERNLEAKRGFLGIGADWDEIRRCVALAFVCPERLGSRG